MVSIYFADKKTERNFRRLESYEELKGLYRFILRAIQDIKHKPDCRTAIPKRLIPREYIRKYDIDNLYKYDLPNA